MSKYFKIAAILTLALIASYVALLFIQPSDIIRKFLPVSFNNPGRVDSAIHKDMLYFIFASIAATMFIRLMESKFRERLIVLAASVLKKVSSVFTLNTLFVLSLIYVIVLFYIAITHYDLGFDEAWYLYYAKNFVSTGIPFYTDNGKIALVDNLSMLPYYLLSIINFKLGLTNVIFFKILSTGLSGIALIILFRVTSKFFSRAIAIVSFFVLTAQSGFGFIASSFFGELLAASFIFLGLYYWLKYPPPYQNRLIYIVSLLFTLALHTKIQCLVVIAPTLLVLHYTDRDSKPLRIFLFTALFTVTLMLIRSLPALILDPKLVRNLLITTFFEGISPPQLFLFDKFQLYNRFFPVSVLLVSLGVFFFYMKSAFDRFLFLFTSITSLWWIFLYPYSTYRNPFMGIIPLSIIIAILLVRLFNTAETKKPVVVKYAAAITVIIFMLYGFSANIIYAYIGYNDGVQFDLDGYRSRLFSAAKEDDSQKEFYGGLSGMVSGSDTLYNGTFVTQFYLDNAVADLPKLNESIRTNPERKFLLITRERYPLGMEKGRQILDSLHAMWQLGLKKGDYEMYIIKK